MVGQSRNFGARSLGRYRRCGWRSAKGCDDSRASEVRDEGRRGCEERVREVAKSRTAGSRKRLSSHCYFLACSVTQSVKYAVSPLDSNCLPSSTASTKFSIIG